jgi:protein TonB
MTALAQRFDVRLAFDDEIGRWSSALVFILAAHVMLGALALPRRASIEASAEPPAAIMVELAAASPTEAAPSELPPAPDQVAAPESEPTPIEVELEELSVEALEPVVEPDAEPLNQATAKPLPETMNRDELKPIAETQTEAEPVTEAAAELALDVPGTVDLAVSADAPEKPTSATAEASPEALDRVEVHVADIVAESAMPPEETRAVEADPALMELLIAAPLPRPQPDVVPEVAERPPEEPRPRAAASRPAAPETTSPAPAPNQAQALVAPRAGAAASAPSVSPDRWRSAVYRHLERHKRYPIAAEARRISGTARVRFTIDRNGNITGHRIVGSSGHPELDQAVSAMIARASPVPAPPPEIYRRGMTLEVPIRFSPR